jgi:type IV secretion system protein VirB6
MPQAIRTVSSRIVESVRGPALQPALVHGHAPPAAEPAERARALAIAEAVAATQRREALAPATPVTHLTGAGAARANGRADAPPPPVRLGQSAQRRTRGRVSSGAGRRDRKA